jgi:hypothetical protein
MSDRDFTTLLAILRCKGEVLVAPGVIVRLGADGRHEAVAYGGHRSSLDQAAVVAAARAALADWPEPILSLEILVTPDPEPTYDVDQLAAARARRARRGARKGGRS